MTHSRRADQAKQDPPDIPGGQPEAVRIKLFGGFQVSVGPRTVGEDEWRLKKAAGLVKLLALEPGHRMHRERVMDLLWPELDEKAATNNLRSALYVARRALEPTLSTAASRYLHRQGEQLILCPERPLWVDVEVFEEAAGVARRALEPGAYRAAVDLYAGDLLPEDRYEEWAENRREGLRRLYLALLVELAGAHEERGDFVPAIETLREVVSGESAHEEAHAGLMRLYALSGRRRKSLGQYEQLRKAISQEGLGAEPDTVSRQLYEEIAAGQSPAARSPREGRASAAPPRYPRHNLPNALSSFAGREREILKVKRILAMTRLLTLTGTGGSGKTRLALEMARDLAGAYPDGVWLVELAPLLEGALVPQTVAEALGVSEQANRPLTDTLVDALQTKKMLLMLDNCEHLLEASAGLVEMLLASCPRLLILATSRETLSIVGEANWRVPPLSLPDSERLLTVEELSGYESARLFLERAEHRNPAFVLAPPNVPAVVNICRWLDGIPLAIELAAARMGTLTRRSRSPRGSKTP